MRTWSRTYWRAQIFQCCCCLSNKHRCCLIPARQAEEIATPPRLGHASRKRSALRLADSRPRAGDLTDAHVAACPLLRIGPRLGVRQSGEARRLGHRRMAGTWRRAPSQSGAARLDPMACVVLSPTALRSHGSSRYLEPVHQRPALTNANGISSDREPAAEPSERPRPRRRAGSPRHRLRSLSARLRSCAPRHRRRQRYPLLVELFLDPLAQYKGAPGARFSSGVAGRSAFAA